MDTNQLLLDSLQDMLGVDLAARILGISKKELFEYDANSALMPEVVINRLEFLIIITGILAGAYNDESIRMWFFRPRVELGGRKPVEILSTGWNPNDADSLLVLRLTDHLRTT